MFGYIPNDSTIHRDLHAVLIVSGAKQAEARSDSHPGSASRVPQNNKTIVQRF